MHRVLPIMATVATGPAVSGASQPVSVLSVLRDRTLQSDLSCTPHAEFTAALSGFPLPEDSPDCAVLSLR